MQLTLSSHVKSSVIRNVPELRLAMKGAAVKHTGCTSAGADCLGPMQGLFNNIRALAIHLPSEDSQVAAYDG